MPPPPSLSLSLANGVLSKKEKKNFRTYLVIKQSYNDNNNNNNNNDNTSNITLRNKKGNKSKWIQLIIVILTR